MNAITRILQSIERGDDEATAGLLPLVYEDLRRLAAHKMAGESPGQTLQATALVHEAWLRVSDREHQDWKGRTHFFAAAAEAMRRILIDKARRKRALRHGGDRQRVEIEDADIQAPAGDDDQLLVLNEALEKFEVQDPQKAALVKLRYFVGLTIEQAAEQLGISEPTAKRWWAYARAWLYEAMRKD